MKKKLFLGVGLIFLGCSSPQFGLNINNEERNLYQEETKIKRLDYNKIKIKPSKDDKILIREYKYSASEDDSKNSAREKAIKQIKILLSEEIGTHITSYLEIKKSNINGIGYKAIKQEIDSLSVAITKLKILQEKWDGKTYYIKASVRVNEQKIMEVLLEGIKARASEKDIKRLNKILAEQKNKLNQKNLEVQKARKKLIRQEIVNAAMKSELARMKKQMIKYNVEEIAQKKEAQKFQTELERKKAMIEKLNKKSSSKIEKQRKEWLATKELLCSFTIGTSKDDMERITDKKFKKVYHYLDRGGKEIDFGRSYSFREYRNYKYDFYIRFKYNYYYRICPTEFLQNTLGYNCIYFNFDNNQMSGRAGCY